MKTKFADAFKASDHKWTADLASADADGDTQTNGQELGDPCGTWVKGMPPGRAADVSNPADPASKSASPTTPACGGGAAATTGSGAGATSGGGSTPDPGTGPGYGTPRPSVPTGACASIAPVGTGGALGALWLAFGAMALRRRVQRKR